MLLSVITPCYNESEVIELFYDELKEVLCSMDNIQHKIIFVDDGSSDDTLIKLESIAEKDSQVRVYTLSRNFGHQIALTAGIDQASGDALIMMDSDLQHPPELIPDMVNQWQHGNDFVSAIRKKTAGTSWCKNFSSSFFYYAFNKLSDTYLPPGAADFCLLSRPVYKQLQDFREKHRFLRGLISWMGFKRAYIFYDAPERAAGVSKYSTAKMFALAMEAALSFSSVPLRLATRLGLLVTTVGFVYLFWILSQFIMQKGLVGGWASTICTILILGGVQLMFIGLIGQYLARIFEEVKGRPLYILREQELGE